MNKTTNKATLKLIALLAVLYPSIALACVSIPPWLFIVAPAVHFFPAALGAIIVGEGKRLWFAAVAFFSYIALYILANLGLFNLLHSGMSFITIFFLPYALIIVALVKKNQKHSSAEPVECTPPLLHDDCAK